MKEPLHIYTFLKGNEKIYYNNLNYFDNYTRVSDIQLGVIRIQTALKALVLKICLSFLSINTTLHSLRNDNSYIAYYTHTNILPVPCRKIKNKYINNVQNFAYGILKCYEYCTKYMSCVYFGLLCL